ncbi:unnamed protein product [Meloidogyne enterolobii]|uniref:Uncharacterized protein n=1 Tax=Meloidogyne enterolobii TaxID=390850 RepID=A0ACB1AV63_MELEN
MQLAQRINDHFEYIKPFLPVLAEQCFWPCIIEDFGAVFERQLEINNTGYLITWIDFYAASFSDLALTYGREDMLDRFPRVLHHCRGEKRIFFSVRQMNFFNTNTSTTEKYWY